MIALTQQEASTSFFVPVLLCWAVVFALLEGARRLRPDVWPAAAPPRSSRPWLDLLVAVLTAAAVLALGSLWSSGALRLRWTGAMGHLAFALEQLVIWSPLPIAMLLRRQPASSAWTGARHLLVRAGVGALLGVVGVLVFSVVRGELSRVGPVLGEAVTLRSAAHFVPVYFEGVGIAFVFVRLRWALGPVVAALVAGLLFAVGHVTGAPDGRPALEVLGFFAFNTAFVAALLLLLSRYRDVVALGVAHWVTDIAIGAF